MWLSSVAGAIGCESGYFFASECNANVTILEMRDEMCKDSNMSQKMALIPRMKKAGRIELFRAGTGDHRKRCYL